MIPVKINKKGFSSILKSAISNWKGADQSLILISKMKGTDR